MKVAVVGGGAAGFFAAVNLAEKNPVADITLFEAAHRPLQKVFISGGGRCNVTHACFDPQRLSEFYPRGQKELRSLFARFQPQDAVRWFERHGLQLKTEADGRMFPVSDSSQDVIDVLTATARQHRVQILTHARVEKIEHASSRFRVQIAGRPQAFVVDKLVLATGYSPPGWKLAESLGHHVLPPVPSLFPFTVKSPIIAGLQGIALERVQGKLQTGDGKKYQAEGPVLITHTGLSGPVIYRLSAWGARSLADARYQGQLVLDLFPDLSDDALRARLNAVFQEAAKKKLANTHFAHLPNRLWLSLLEASGALLEERGETAGKKLVNKLVENLKRLPLPVSGKSPSKEEFVSCGGVPLKEVDFKTMESRLVPGLYFGGEILDIDGLTGGFNFQACWSEGWVISEALAAQA